VSADMNQPVEIFSSSYLSVRTSSFETRGGWCCNPIGEVGEKKKEINRREKNTSVLLSTLSPVYLALIIQVSMLCGR
jgi:hypothetical protein